MLMIKPIWVLRFAAIWVLAHVVIVPAQIFFQMWWQAALSAVTTVVVGKIGVESPWLLVWQMRLLRNWSMEHKQEICKPDDGERHNEFPTESVPFTPPTAWTPEWKTARDRKQDNEEDQVSNPRN